MKKRFKKFNWNPFKMVLPYIIGVFLSIYFLILTLYSWGDISGGDSVTSFIIVVFIVGFLIGYIVQIFLRFLWNLLFKKYRWK